jgi:hypothetical protein
MRFDVLTDLLESLLEHDLSQDITCPGEVEDLILIPLVLPCREMRIQRIRSEDHDVIFHIWDLFPDAGKDVLIHSKHSIIGAPPFLQEHAGPVRVFDDETTRINDPCEGAVRSTSR